MTTNELSKVPVRTLVTSPNLKKKFEDVLGDKAPQFISSLVNVVNSTQSLQNVDQMSVIQTAMVAASLDLPIDKNLGYMWLVPYKHQATPQIGYKGYIQLAQRSGQYRRMNAIVVYEGEFGGWNPLTEELIYTPENKSSDKVVGYLGHFELLNGFEKTVFWTREEVDKHRQRFSKMSGGNTPSGVWRTDFDAMALKTVLRNMLTKWGPMSVYMQTAISKDEQVIDVNEVEETESDSVADKLEQQLQKAPKDVSPQDETEVTGNATNADEEQSKTADETEQTELLRRGR